MSKIPYGNLNYSNVEVPFLNIVIHNPIQSSSKEVQALIDTGYDGELIITKSLYQDLQLTSFELSRDQFSVAETASGERLSLQSAYGLIEILELDLEIEIIVDSHEKCQEIIIGRKFLEDFNICLYGKEKMYTIDIPNS